MALLDAYATLAEFRARTSDDGLGANATIEAQLTAASRLVERSLRLAPGAFNSATGTRVFSGNGKPTLWLIDEQGLNFLQSVSTDGIAVDEDNDGDAEYNIDPTGETWVIGLPKNAVSIFSEPFDRLTLLPNRSATFECWPCGDWNISITGTWGWASVPAAIKELVIARTSDMVFGHLGGPAESIPEFGGGGGSSLASIRTFSAWKAVREMYGYRRPRFVK